MTDSATTPDGDRRIFLRSCARGILLGSLVAAGALLTRRPGDDVSSDACDRDGLCRGCALQTGCRLPAALAYRSVPKEPTP
jgi:hypothetical protein